jgi:hypothetical protein
MTDCTPHPYTRASGRQGFTKELISIHALHPLDALRQLNGPLPLGLVLYHPTQVDNAIIRLDGDRQRG